MKAELCGRAAEYPGPGSQTVLPTRYKYKDLQAALPTWSLVGLPFVLKELCVCSCFIVLAAAANSVWLMAIIASSSFTVWYLKVLLSRALTLQQSSSPVYLLSPPFTVGKSIYNNICSCFPLVHVCLLLCRPDLQHSFCDTASTPQRRITPHLLSRQIFCGLCGILGSTAKVNLVVLWSSSSSLMDKTLKFTLKLTLYHIIHVSFESFVSSCGFFF